MGSFNSIIRAGAILVSVVGGVIAAVEMASTVADKFKEEKEKAVEKRDPDEEPTVTEIVKENVVCACKALAAPAVNSIVFIFTLMGYENAAHKLSRLTRKHEIFRSEVDQTQSELWSKGVALARDARRVQNGTASTDQMLGMAMGYLDSAMSVKDISKGEK